MNFLDKEKEAHKKEKAKRRHKFFHKKRPHTSKKSAKARCGIKGCTNEATTLKGKIPDCGNHK